MKIHWKPETRLPARQFGNWKLNFGSNDDVLIKRYLYVVGNDQLVEKLLNVGVKKIYKFDRYKGESKNYLLEVPNLSGN